jgi:hypothetical protein
MHKEIVCSDQSKYPKNKADPKLMGKRREGKMEKRVKDKQGL